MNEERERTRHITWFYHEFQNTTERDKMISWASWCAALLLKSDSQTKPEPLMFDDGSPYPLNTNWGDLEGQKK